MSNEEILTTVQGNQTFEYNSVKERICVGYVMRGKGILLSPVVQLIGKKRKEEYQRTKEHAVTGVVGENSANCRTPYYDVI